MTAQIPAPKASAIPAPPASSASVAPAPSTSVKEDFLSMILQAVAPAANTAEHAAEAQPAREKPASAETPATDATAAGMLLALLVPPLPVPAEAPTRKGSAPGKHAGTIANAGPAALPTAQEQKGAEAKPAKRDAAPALVAAAEPPEDKTPPPSGTPAANTYPGMNMKSERTEIAGKTEQKLPMTAVSAVKSGDTGSPSPEGGKEPPLSFSWHEGQSEQLAIIDLSAKNASLPAPAAVGSVEAPARVAGPVPMERLEKMISGEVLSVRQTGAETLGVALKLDSNTQLFLQLTTNNGLMQASLRCDRGQFAPEDSQWAQLQESLARQNVELLPMTGGSQMNFQQPSGQHSRQQASREDWPSGDAAPQAQPRQQKGQNRSRKNWESWA